MVDFDSLSEHDVDLYHHVQNLFSSYRSGRSLYKENKINRAIKMAESSELGKELSAEFEELKEFPDDYAGD